MRWSLDPVLSWKQHNDEHYSWFTANITDPEVQREFWLLRSRNSCAGTCGQQQFVPIPGSSWELFHKTCKYSEFSQHSTERGSTLPSQSPANTCCFPSWISIPKGKDICLESLKTDKDTKAIYPFFFPLISHCGIAVQVFPLARATSAPLEILNSQIQCLEMMPQYFSWEWHKNLAEKCSLSFQCSDGPEPF